MIGIATSIIPAGLLDNNQELFSHNNEEYVTSDGRVIPYSAFPQWILDLLDAKIESDPDVSESLIEADILDPDMARRQAIRCLYGVFDGKADIVDGVLQHPEYWNCSLRGSCEYEGRLCKALLIHDNIYLTPREVEVTKLIDLQAKEIADLLKISVSTVPKFKQNIFEKLGMNRTADVIKFAISKNLIQIH